MTKNVSHYWSWFRHFISHGIWRIPSRDLSRGKVFLITALRVVLLAFRGFDEDKCQLRASALTFYTLLSIVPLAAMGFGIAKGFGFEKLLEQQVMAQLPGQVEAAVKIIEYAQNMLMNTKGSYIAGVGILILLWTVIKVLGTIEKSFNDIWEIKSGRNLWRKISDYLSLVTIGPILFIFSSSATVFVSAKFVSMIQSISFLEVFSPLMLYFMKWVPYLLIWVLFSAIYIIIPNNRVNFSSGILGGVVAGSIYQFIQWAYFFFQIGVSKYNAIYGSFAALPLFLMWIQTSWLIVLFGAEISFAHQNVDTYEFEHDCQKISHSFKRLVTLRIFHHISQTFLTGEDPLTDGEISHQLELPLRLVRNVLFDLQSSRLLLPVKTKHDKETAYQISQEIESKKLSDIIDAWESWSEGEIPLKESEEFFILESHLKQMYEALKSSPENVSFTTIFGEEQTHKLSHKKGD